MKVILDMAITANGLIAGEGDDVDWVSEESWKIYLKTVKKTKCAIIGRRTYEIMPPEEFVKSCLYVIYTHRKAPKKPKTDNIIFTGKSPKKLLKEFKNKKIKEIRVFGGSQICALFMRERLIDEIYLAVEPVVLGKGIPLFAPNDFKFDLELLSVKKLSPQTIQLHYKVKK